MMEGENESECFKFSNEIYLRKTWPSYTFIMPAVSVGNVGQLAIDILLNNLTNVTKICSIYDNCVVPVVGKDQFNDGICTSLELFVCEEKKFVIMQQRSPFVKGRIPAFRNKLMAWIEKSEFSSVVMLSSVSAHIRKDKEIGSSSLCFLSSTSDLKDEVVEKLQCKEYAIKKTDGTDDYHLPGAGIVKSLLQDCEKKLIPFLSLLIFCHPGNNTREALQLVECLRIFYKHLDLKEKLKLPLTWRQPASLEAGYIF